MSFCLTNKRCSHNHGILVVGQPRYAVGILGRPEVKYVPDVFTFVVHWFGSFRWGKETDFNVCIYNL